MIGILQRIAIKIEKQVAFPAATNTGDDLHKPVVPDGHELIYVEIALYHHFPIFVLYFGFKLPFHKTAVLYHKTLTPATALPPLLNNFLLSPACKAAIFRRHRSAKEP